MKPFALQARYVLSLDGRAPSEGGVVTIAEGRIVAVGENLSGRPPLDLGDVALLPGLVNAHTHLEFSDLEAPLGEPGMALPQWIRAVLAYRMRSANALATTGEASTELAGATSRAASPVDVGLAQAIATTTIGEIATQLPSLAPYARGGPDVVIFRELLGLPSDRLSHLTDCAQSHLAQFASRDASAELATPRLSAGLSPHAPYSIHPAAARMAVELSRGKGNVPLAMHLAESREELELLATGAGPFRDLLEERGVWESDAIPRDSRPLDYLRMLSQASRSLIIHGNYLQRDELEFIAQQQNRMSLVYCPRTHAYFQHERYPLELALERGAPLAIGTDSLASNPDLDMLSELRFLAQEFPRLSPETILRLGTIGGARALGFEESVGTIEPGKLANLLAVALPGGSATPYEQTLLGQGVDVGVWQRGQPRALRAE